MPNYTGNLNLAKPIPMEDVADIQVINENMDKLDQWSTGVDEKTKAATSAIPGIVKYGTEASTALEGSKLAEILGIEYGGVLNNTNAKVAGKGYYDTANKKIYKCTANTSINYADAGYFIEVSNNDLLGKLQNLDIKKIIVFSSSPTISANDLIAGTQLDGIVRLDLSKIPANYTIVSFYIWCDSLELENFAYGSPVLLETSHFRFARRNAGKGFKIVASVIRL